MIVFVPGAEKLQTVTKKTSMNSLYNMNFALEKI